MDFLTKLNLANGDSLKEVWPEECSFYYKPFDIY